MSSSSFSLPPLTGLKVVEFAGLAPGPYAGMMLADAGASVIRIDRASASYTPDVLARRKSSIVVDLKSSGGVALVRRLCVDADVLIDPFRPGVLEKLGLGPETLCAANPRLVYARMTGFRRDGRYSKMAGHDINYLAVSGVLGMLGRADEPPHPPINLLADFAGGGAMLAHGILLALISRGITGKGQVVEANMVDGAGYVATFPRTGLKTALGNRPRGQNKLDGGCPFYDTYTTKDGKYMAVGALEPQFFALLMTGLGLNGQGWEHRREDTQNWPELRRIFTDKFASKTRAQWEKIFDGTDACVTPILDYSELEAGSSDGQDREGDQRPAVTLRGTPCYALSNSIPPISGLSSVAPERGQGQGVPGTGYAPSLLKPGEGGEAALRQWLGWEEDREYEKEKRGWVLKGAAGGARL